MEKESGGERSRERARKGEKKKSKIEREQGGRVRERAREGDIEKEQGREI